jgi:hypothetical protein
MKSIKSAIAICAVLLGSFGALAFKPATAAPKPFNQILVAVSTDGVHFSWQPSPPAGYTCQAATGTCKISTSQTGTPPPDTYPSSYTVLQGVDKDSAYMPN